MGVFRGGQHPRKKHLQRPTSLEKPTSQELMKPPQRLF